MEMISTILTRFDLGIIGQLSMCTSEFEVRSLPSFMQDAKSGAVAVCVAFTRSYMNIHISYEKYSVFIHDKSHQFIPASCPICHYPQHSCGAVPASQPSTGTTITATECQPIIFNSTTKSITRTAPGYSSLQ